MRASATKSPRDRGTLGSSPTSTSSWRSMGSRRSSTASHSIGLAHRVVKADGLPDQVAYLLVDRAASLPCADAAMMEVWSGAGALRVAGEPGRWRGMPRAEDHCACHVHKLTQRLVLLGFQ